MIHIHAATGVFGRSFILKRQSKLGYVVKQNSHIRQFGNAFSTSWIFTRFFFFVMFLFDSQVLGVILCVYIHSFQFHTTAPEIVPTFKRAWQSLPNCVPNWYISSTILSHNTRCMQRMRSRFSLTSLPVSALWAAT